MSIIDGKELSSIREKHKDEKIVFCSGSFDLTHAGHVLFFEDCKKYGDILVVMVGNDSILRIYKGAERPVLNQHIRLKMVSSIKSVTYALLDQNLLSTDLLSGLNSVFSTLKPDYYVITTDAFDIPKRRELLKSSPTKLVILERACPPEVEAISTTKIIEKIKSIKPQGGVLDP